MGLYSLLEVLKESLFFCLSQLHLWPPWSVFKAVNGGLSPCVTSLQPSFASLLHFSRTFVMTLGPPR